MVYETTLDAAQFFKQVNSYLNATDRAQVQAAFALARREHGEQRRKSGELFFSHPLAVAYYLSKYHLDAPALCAALLHDVAEDTLVSIEQIEEEFGPEVARLVDGVTKLKNVSRGIAQGKQLSDKEVQDASLHKLFGVMITDVRAVIIKLFDRLHNMRTIKAMPPHKQREKARETLAVYAPLANRLGIWKLKNELEALSLEVLHNKAYHIIRQRLEHVCREHQQAYEIVSAEIFDCLLQADLDVRNVSLAPENIYTIFQDLSTNGAAYDGVDKTMRLEILLNDWDSCYLALGYLHQMWKPVPGKFDDYIAIPRDNLYRSLHTTVVHSSGQQLKLRLRTVAMGKVSEIGVLARWLYAGTPLWTHETAGRIEALFDNINENINVEPLNPSAGVKGVVEDIFRKQIRVYTPRGEVVELPQGATPIDFAYAIHTGLGDQCHAAYVNEVLSPLNRPLQDGDRVRIAKKLRAQPQRAWLDEDLGYIATNYARSHARRWFRRLSPEAAVNQGRQLLQYELDMLGFSSYPHERVAALFEYVNTVDLYHDLGRAELLPTVVATRVLEESWSQELARSLDNVVYSSRGEQYIITNAANRQLRLCATCNPRPRDPIVGYVRKDSGVTVHNEGCHSLRPERMSGRQLKLGWGEGGANQVRVVTIQISVYDRASLLFEIAQLMHEEKINITYINTPSSPPQGEMRIILSLALLRPRQLVRILHQAQSIANVYDVRVLPGGPPTPEIQPLPASFYRPE